MRIDILTLFPEMCEGVLGESIVGRARSAGKVCIRCHNIRSFTTDRHGHVDDYPYGGGPGMVLQPMPIYDCFMHVCRETGRRPHLVYLSAQGRVFSQKEAVRLSRYPNLALLCGHYEGVDERVLEEIVDEEISLGDFVLTGGELPALAVADAVVRMLPGVLKSDESYTEESHFAGLLEYPQYTRPPEFLGRKVPAVLQNGNRARIIEWKHRQALAATLRKRPDLLEKAALSETDRAAVEALRAESERESGRAPSERP